MNFISFAFLFFFITVSVLYYALPHKYRWPLLLLASCYFYMSFIPVYILVLGGTILIDYLTAIQIERSQGTGKRLFLNISIISTCLILFVFKYFNFFNENIAGLARAIHWNYSIAALKIILPIGLSFHTFQSLSYVFEVYRGNQKAERHFGIYALYVMFYPQLVAGPIERPQQLLPQLKAQHKFSYEQVRSGLFLMLLGVFKKVVIADRLAQYVALIYERPGYYHGWPVALAVVFFSIQIYCDFSGYSDIAIGSARVLGIELMSNFSSPYRSGSVTDFWRRWHISLSTWFRDYVYFPLGGSRVPVYRWYFNLMVVFLISGLWHGANWTFIAWGAAHGVAVVYESATRAKRKKLSALLPPAVRKILATLITFSFVSFLWIFFRAPSINDAIAIITSLFQPSSLKSTLLPGYSFLGFALMILYVVFILLSEHRPQNAKILYDGLLQSSKTRRWSVYTIMILSIIILGNFEKMDFIYFQF